MREAVLIAAMLTLWALGSEAGHAQGAQVPFGDVQHDAALPVEITADALALDQAAGTAVFTGGVKVGQGGLRLSADRIEVFYAGDGDASGEVSRMEATGNVTLSNGAEAAEARTAVYDVASGVIEMEGDVLLTQNANALSSEKMLIDLTTGTGTLQGRVQTIFVPGTGQ